MVILRPIAVFSNFLRRLCTLSMTGNLISPARTNSLLLQKDSSRRLRNTLSALSTAEHRPGKAPTQWSSLVSFAGRTRGSQEEWELQTASRPSTHNCLGKYKSTRRTRRLGKWFVAWFHWAVAPRLTDETRTFRTSSRCAWTVQKYCLSRLYQCFRG